MRISYSALEAYNQCPLKYKFSYIDWVKIPPKPEFFFGSLIHEIVQIALRRDPIIPPMKDLIKIFESKWREEIFPDQTTAEEYFNLGKQMIADFHGFYKPGLRKVIASEKRFQIPLGEHTLSGIIDRIDRLPFGAMEIIDYKTSKVLPTQADVDQDRQLSIYAIAVKEIHPEAQDLRLTLHFLKHNKLITTARTPEQLELMKFEIIKTADKILRTKKFGPKENKFCDWCEYKHLCPLKKDEQPVEPPFQQIARDYIAAYKKIMELAPKIQAHLDNEKIDKLELDGNSISRDSGRNLWVDSSD